MAIQLLSLFLAALCAAAPVAASPAPFASMPATLSGRSLKLRSMRAQIALNPHAARPVTRLSGANLTTNDLETLTDMSSNLDKVVKSINVVNAGWRGAQIAVGLDDIVSRIRVSTQDLSGMAPLADSDAVRVVNDFQALVKAHQALLNTVIGKHGVLSLFFLTKPVRSSLVALEAAADRYAYALIDLVPTRHHDAVKSKLMVDASVQTAIVVYSK